MSESPGLIGFSRPRLSGRVDANAQCTEFVTNATVPAAATVLLVFLEVIALAATFRSAALALARVLLALGAIATIRVLVALLADLLAAG